MLFRLKVLPFLVRRLSSNSHKLNIEYFQSLNYQEEDLNEKEFCDQLISEDLVFLDRDFVVLNKRVKYRNTKYDFHLMNQTLQEIIPSDDANFIPKSPLYSRFVSGLIPFARSRLGFVKLRAYYQSYERNLSADPFNFICLCWGLPSLPKKDKSNFLISFYNIDQTIYGINGFLYKVPDHLRSTNLIKKGEQETKLISHNTLSTSQECSKACLIQVQTKSSIRGLVELYLIHHGSQVIGEFLQASRLIYEKESRILLPPANINLKYQLPNEIALALGDAKLKREHLVPMIHSQSLAMPGLLFDKETPEYFYNEKIYGHTYYCNKQGLQVGTSFYTPLPKHFSITMQALGINPIDLNSLIKYNT